MAEWPWRVATFGRLDAERLDGHRYEDAVLKFADDLLATCGGGLPSAVVVDIGLLAPPEHGVTDQWAVVEANMAWFSNCYAADPDRVLDVVLCSAGPREQMAERDRGFVRSSRTLTRPDEMPSGGILTHRP
ncbi:hypothetical protein ABZ547_33425 [Streptomyces sparsogenes]|uniref:hypothetical protein n=1 Tax=Streptomyces sparsogenes TaxID=67365 RepID=UPI0033CB4375